MVEQRDVIGGVAVPAVRGGDRGARLAAGVALIHRDDPVIRGELGRRIDRRGRLAPHRDHRLEAGRRKGQDRKPSAELLVVDAGAVVLKARHVGVLSSSNAQADILSDRARWWVGSQTLLRIGGRLMADPDVSSTEGFCGIDLASQGGVAWLTSRYFPTHGGDGRSPLPSCWR